MKKTWKLAVLAAAGCLLTIAAPRPVAAQNNGVTLVAAGTAAATLVLPPAAADDEKLAAEELRDHIERISGARLTIGERAPDRGAAILIGRAAPDGFLDQLAGQTDRDASFRIRAAGNRVAIAGLSAEGTLFAAYALLEQLGVRWLLPDEIGTVIPQSAEVNVPFQDHSEIPSFAGRHLQAIGEMGHRGGSQWARRQRLGGFNAGAHGLPMRPAPDRETEPDMFMEEDGRLTGKVRVNHPETLRRVIAETRRRLDNNIGVQVHEGVRYVSMGPKDGLGFGEDPWDAGDIDPLHGRVSVTDRYIRFFNKVLAAVADEHPDAGIAFYCYSQHMRAPVREKPHPHILPVLAQIDVCRFHAIDTPHCWERRYVAEVIEDWRALGTRMMYRGYIFNLADPSLPFSMIRQTAVELPYYHRAGMFASRIETKPAWGYQGPSLYLAARLMWNAEADVEEELREYFEGLYGPAAAAMRRHFEILEDAFEQADFHTGNVFDFPHILTPAVMRGLAATLAEAERRSRRQPAAAARVAMVRLAFDYGDTFLEMMRAVNRHDFITAKRALDRIYNELVPPAVNHEPPVLSRRYVPGFINRFWRDIVEQGYARVTAGNRPLAMLPDQWLTMLDPRDGGESLGLWRPELGTASWTPRPTFSTSWSNQGLRYYKGPGAIMWYRTTVTLPAAPDHDGEIFLWLGGVDNQAEAWLNGHKLPLVRSGTAPIGRPWEFRATGATRPGAENVIVVKTVNDVHRELGTGGLTGPAMIWLAGPEKPAPDEEQSEIDPREMLPGQ